jgi:hypothetical protein
LIDAIFACPNDVNNCRKPNEFSDAINRPSGSMGRNRTVVLEDSEQIGKNLQIVRRFWVFQYMLRRMRAVVRGYPTVKASLSIFRLAPSCTGGAARPAPWLSRKVARHEALE